MNQTELSKHVDKLNQLAAQAMTLEKRYSAHLMLYEAACMTGNENEITTRREECHTLLDDILDNVRISHLTSSAVNKLLQG